MWWLQQLHRKDASNSASQSLSKLIQFKSAASYNNSSGIYYAKNCGILISFVVLSRNIKPVCHVVSLFRCTEKSDLVRSDLSLSVRSVRPMIRSSRVGCLSACPSFYASVSGQHLLVTIIAPDLRITERVATGDKMTFRYD
jgi:hypothetical protein